MYQQITSLTFPFWMGALCFFASGITTVHARTFTVTNNCPFTIWPALFTDHNVGSAIPNQPTGWVAEPNTSTQFQVPDNWRAGRIWARRNCDFSTTNDVNSCISGGCNGGLLCDDYTGTGVPPVSLAEWTLSGDGNRDFYDVSLVDGYNIPMRIDNNVGCPVADCSVDLGPSCPETLKGPFDSGGYALGCKTACQIDPNPQNSPNCCSGSYDKPATCPPSGVQYYSFFKNACPNAYAYAYDEGSGNALFTCDSGLGANYILTFCPAANSSTSVASNGTALPVNSMNSTLATSGSVSGSASATSGSFSGSVSSASESPAITAVKPNASAILRTMDGAWLLAVIFCVHGLLQML